MSAVRCHLPPARPSPWTTTFKAPVISTSFVAVISPFKILPPPLRTPGAGPPCHSFRAPRDPPPYANSALPLRTLRRVALPLGPRAAPVGLPAWDTARLLVTAALQQTSARRAALVHTDALPYPRTGCADTFLPLRIRNVHYSTRIRYPLPLPLARPPVRSPSPSPSCRSFSCSVYDRSMSILSRHRSHSSCSPRSRSCLLLSLHLAVAKLRPLLSRTCTIG